MTREEAIQEFLADHDLGIRARATLEAVLRQNPRALLLVWETDRGLGLTAVPFSKALANGLVTAAADIMFGDDVEEAGPVDEEEDN